jgi:hypothetical protein
MQMLQFKAAVQSDWFAQLSATGVTVVSYLPDNAYLVSGNAQQLQTLADSRRKPALRSGWANTKANTTFLLTRLLKQTNCIQQ